MSDGTGSRSYRYPAKGQAADFALASFGLACTLGPLALVQPAAPATWALSAGAALFLVYFARTVCRQLTRYELDVAGIRAKGPLGAALRWDQLCLVRLDYFSTRTIDRAGGWMQLRLSDGQRTLRIDSELEGFADLVRAAARAAARRELAMDAATLSNLEALGGGDGGTSVPLFRDHA